MSFFGIIYSCFLCFLQRDFKRLIAFSRIVHINFILVNLTLFINELIFYCFLIIIYHGLISRLIFIKVGFIYYYSKTRKFYFLNFRSLKRFFFINIIFIFILNFSPPLTIGFFAEVFYFISVLNKKYFFFFFFFFFFFIFSIFFFI